MTTPRSNRSPLSIENDRHEFLELGASVFISARQELDALLQNFTRAIASSVDGDGSDDTLTSYEIRLGSTRMSLDQLKALKPQDIVTLTEATPGKVQIWHNGRLCGLGALLIVDGKLAVRVESIDPTDASAQ